MKEFFKQLLSEQGTISLTRFVTLIVTIVALTIAIYGTYKQQAVTELVSLLLGISLTGKVAQKFIEK